MKSSNMALLFLALVLSAGCGGGGGGSSAPTLVSISVTPVNPIIPLGTIGQFTATGHYSDNSTRNITTLVIWSSSTTTVATISNAAGFEGSAVLVSTGTTVITAKSGSRSAFTTLTVIVPALVSIEVKPAVSSIHTTSTEQFTATGIYSNNSTTDITLSVTWTSSTPDVAMIDNNGLATAVSTATTATTMITAKSGSASGSAILTVTGGAAAPAPNVLPITVNGSLCSSATSSNYINKPCVSVTICTPGTSTCQTIDDILLDTGSFGLRIFKQALSISLTQATSGTGSLAECVQFADGSSDWGPVQLADVILGNEPPVTVPIQVIDSKFGTVPSTCGVPDTSPAIAGYTGILGTGVFVQDCGSICESFSNNGMYYSCSGSTCSGATVPINKQVSNPVASLPTDSNGVVVELPTVLSNGTPSVDGILVLGIGTRANNMSSGVTTFAADQFGEIVTIFGGTSYNSIIDSGSNGLFFTPPSTGLLPNCPFPDSEWFCPASITTLSATNTGVFGSPSSDVLFQIDNFESLTTNLSNKVFSNNGGSLSNLFDWGLPFYFGRNIFVGIEGTTSSVGTGPYFAY